MTRLAMTNPAAATPQARRLFEAVQEQLGAIPNLMRVLATNPTVLAAYLGFSGALGRGRLGPKLHEQIALTVAEANGCGYCLAAHSFLGQKAGLKISEIHAARAAVSINQRTASTLAMAQKLVTSRGRLSATDIAQARSAGLNDADMIEVIAAVALNIFTNYVNLAAETEIDFPPAGKLEKKIA